jgi:hypothetical protein
LLYIDNHTITKTTIARTEAQIIGLTTNHDIAIVVNPTTNAKQKLTIPVAAQTRFPRNGITLAIASRIPNIIENHAHSKNIPTNLRIHVIIVLLEYACSNNPSIEILLSSIRAITLQLEVV